MYAGSRGIAYARMAAFPLGLGMTSVLVQGTLNRIMIVERGLPASLVGLCFALPLLIAPVRVWLGYQSDTRPLWGFRRAPYILAGAFLSGVGMLVATLLVLALSRDNLLLAVAMGVLLLLSFLLYGLGKHMSSNTFEALIADTFQGPQRPRAVTLFKVVMFLGIIGTAVILGNVLDPFSPTRLAIIAGGVLLLMLLLTVLAVIGQERRAEHVQEAVDAARMVSFRATIKTVLWPNPHLRRFFLLVMLVIVGTLAQDILLEPYGGLVLGMTPGETTRLTALWGAGTMLSMLTAGLGLIQRHGYQPVLRAGLALSIVVFGGLIVVGALHAPHIFQSLVFVLGLGSGLSAAGLLTAVVEHTTAARAGTLMGVWGVAHECGEAIGSLLGGGIVDVVRLLSGGNAWMAYSTVFALEAVLLLVALVLLGRSPGPAARVVPQPARDEVPSLHEAEI